MIPNNSEPLGSQGIDGLLPIQMNCTPLKCLQATGTQYIQFSSYTLDTDSYSVDFELTHRSEQDMCILMLNFANFDILQRVDIYWINWVNQLLVGTSASSGYQLVEATPDIPRAYSFRDYNISRGTVTINNRTHHFAQGKFAAGERVVNLFSGYREALIRYPAFAKISQAYALRNNVYVWYLVPILDTWGRPCMFDRVSGRHYYNKGTGEFLWELEQ